MLITKLESKIHEGSIRNVSTFVHKCACNAKAKLVEEKEAREELEYDSRKWSERRKWRDDDDEEWRGFRSYGKRHKGDW